MQAILDVNSRLFIQYFLSPFVIASVCHRELIMNSIFRYTVARTILYKIDLPRKTAMIGQNELCKNVA